MVRQKSSAKFLPSRIETVTTALEGYAQRGVFRGFSPVSVSPSEKASFRLLWHYDQIFEFVFDPQKNTMRIPAALTNIPSDSEMYQELKEFIKARQSVELPEHRRIDKTKVRVSTANRRNNVTLTLKLKNGDDEYGVKKLIHLMHEIYLIFLMDGRYYQYLVDNFDLDPDRM